MRTIPAPAGQRIQVMADFPAVRQPVAVAVRMIRVRAERGFVGAQGSVTVGVEIGADPDLESLEDDRAEAEP